MSCFKLPKGLIKEIEVLIRKFWWGYSGDAKKVHWVSWERLCEAKEVGGMWFKDIEQFNNALLVKQVWRMMNNPDSLCFRVFKACFFPNCSILDVEEKAPRSYAWKSILSARDVIRKCMVWRIGDGQSVRVKEDKWIPTRPGSVPASPLSTALPDPMVGGLINHDLGIWKSNLVHQHFLPHEARLILGIPLSPRFPSDRVVWSLTPSSKFSTSSAYKLLAATASVSQAGSSSSEQLHLFWRRIWRLRVPNKIIHFIWRACTNALPTKCNLRRRKIFSSDTCELCHGAAKDALHALWLCKGLEDVWKAYHWTQPATSPLPLNFCELMDRFLQVQDDYRKEIFAISTWLIWNRRNASHFGCLSQPLESVSIRVGALLQEFIAVQEVDLSLPESAVMHQWRPPEQGIYKVNFDAAVFKSSNTAGIGVIIRDWGGQAIGALSMSMPLANSVSDMEALACRRAVQFAVDLGLHRVFFEGDSVIVINAVSQENAALSLYGFIVEDILSLVSSFLSFEFVHVPRSGNIVANALAKKAKELVGCQVWSAEMPADIAPLVGFDVH